MTKSDMRICADCEFRTFNGFYGSDTCDLEDVYERCLVTGMRVLVRQVHCSEVRSHGKLKSRLLRTCGKEGSFWIKK